MAGVDGSSPQFGEIRQGAGHLFSWGVQQVESADDVDDALVTADAFGVLDGVADAGVGAAGNDDQPVRGLISQGGVIQQVVGGGLAIVYLADGVFGFKVILAGNFAEEDEIVCQPDGVFGEAQGEVLGQLVGGEDGADLAEAQGVKGFACQGSGVSD